MSTNNSNYPINLNDNPDYSEQEYILVASPRTPFTDPSSEPYVLNLYIIYCINIVLRKYNSTIWTWLGDASMSGRVQ